jgi:hypothetical protein
VLAKITDDAMLIALFRYWERKRAGRRMPTRQEMDPIEMGPALLPHLLVSEFVDGGARLRFRLIGSAIAANAGMDATGLCADEVLAGSYLTHIVELHRECWTRSAPVYSESVFRWDAGGHRWTRRLLLPLGAREADRIIAGQTFGGEQEEYRRLRRVVIDEVGEHEEVKREILEL